MNCCRTSLWTLSTPTTKKKDHGSALFNLCVYGALWDFLTAVRSSSMTTLYWFWAVEGGKKKKVRNKTAFVCLWSKCNKRNYARHVHPEVCRLLSPAQPAILLAALELSAHHSAITKQWWAVNPIWAETRAGQGAETRVQKSGPAQVMAKKFMPFG